MVQVPLSRIAGQVDTGTKVWIIRFTKFAVKSMSARQTQKHVFVGGQIKDLSCAKSITYGPNRSGVCDQLAANSRNSAPRTNARPEAERQLFSRRRESCRDCSVVSRLPDLMQSKLVRAVSDAAAELRNVPQETKRCQAGLNVLFHEHLLLPSFERAARSCRSTGPRAVRR